MEPRRFSSGSTFEEKIGYSRAVDDGSYVFVSGTTGYDYAHMTISDDVMQQAEQCLRNIRTALEACGSSLEKVVRVRYIFHNREDFEPCWPVFQKYLGKAKPAATLIIAELMDEKMRVEIEVTARSGSNL
jgi:enamine deaminase RidA (YjgF/YER057c/UK114 family)